MKAHIDVLNDILDYAIKVEDFTLRDNIMGQLTEIGAELGPLPALRSIIAEEVALVQSFDHDDVGECKGVTSNFIEAYMSYKDYLREVGSRSSTGYIHSFAWFRNLRKLVKQTAFSMLIKALDMESQQIPGDESGMDDVYFDPKKYESTIQKFYRAVIETWGKIDGDAENECNELVNDWKEMIHFGDPDSDDYFTNIFYKLDENRRSFRRVKKGLTSTQEDMDEGAQVIAEESRQFVKNILEFLRSVEAALPVPVLASHAFAKLEVESSSTTAGAGAGAGASKAKAHVRKPSYDNDPSNRRAGAPAGNGRMSDRTVAYMQQIQMRSISGPRPSAAPISANMEEEEKDEDEEEVRGGERSDDYFAGNNDDGYDSEGSLSKPLRKKPRVPPSDDEDDLPAASSRGASAEKARKERNEINAMDMMRKMAKTAGDAAVGLKRKHKRTLKANAGDDGDTESEEEKDDYSLKPITIGKNKVQGSAKKGSSSSKVKSNKKASPKKEKDDVDEERPREFLGLGPFQIKRIKNGSMAERPRPPKPLGKGRQVSKSPDGTVRRKAKKWTFEEEETLIEAVKIHGADWAEILKDARFMDLLAVRSNVDLKDKYRNMVKSGKADALPARPKGFHSEMGSKYGGSASHVAIDLSRERQFKKHLEQVKAEAEAMEGEGEREGEEEEEIEEDDD